MTTEIIGTEGWNPSEANTAGRIFERRLGWNTEMVNLLRKDREATVHRLAMIDSNIETILADSAKLATSDQITKPRGIQKICRHWEGVVPWESAVLVGPLQPKLA